MTFIVTVRIVFIEQMIMNIQLLRKKHFGLNLINIRLDSERSSWSIIYGTLVAYIYIYIYHIFSNLIRTRFTVSEG
jgi:hypothetical protein